MHFYLTISTINLFSLIQSYTIGCPDNTAVCTYNGEQYRIIDPSAPKCWTKETDDWSCIPKSENGCDSYNTLDISQCKYALPPYMPPEIYCPKFTDSCTMGGNSYLATDPDVPPCWNKFKEKWGCAYKQANGHCKLNIFYVDVIKCRYYFPLS